MTGRQVSAPARKCTDQAILAPTSTSLTDLADPKIARDQLLMVIEATGRRESVPARKRTGLAMVAPMLTSLTDPADPIIATQQVIRILNRKRGRV